MRRIIYSLLLVVLLWSPLWSVVDAQEEGDATGHIVGNHAEIVFPAVIRFYVSVDVQLDQIQTVSLTIHQISGLDVTLAVNPNQHLAKIWDDSIDLVYDWNITGNPGPIPFEPLNYLWQIEIDDEISIAADEILFEDAVRGTWDSSGEPPLTLYWHNPNLAGGAIRNDVLAAYGLISRQAARSPLFRYVIYDPRVSLCETEQIPDSEETRSVVFADDETAFPCDVEQYIQVYANGSMTFLQRPDTGYAQLQDFLVQRMVDDTYTQLWGDVSVPDWFLTGLSSLYQLRPTYAALQTVRTAARSDSLIPLSAMADRPANDTTFQYRVLWEAQSYMVVLFLADRYGANAPFDLARELREGGFDSAFQALIGDEFWNEWNRWLFSEAADKAISWTPYQPNTPTPTATPTITPVPPTLTPSATRTETPTATSTYLGDQLPTPVVAVQASVTAARSPTNTPLPPGSLPTASVEAPITEETTSEENDINPVLLVGVIVLAGSMILLMIVVLINRIRRR